MKQRDYVFYSFAAIMLFLCSLSALFPFIYMALVSLTQKTILNFDFKISEFSFVNYVRVFKNFNIIVNLRNSFIVTSCACFFNALFSSMAAYVFAKKKFKGSDVLFALYIATLMIPGQVTLVPVFLIMKALGLLNTYPALIFPVVNAFGVFLVKQFMESVPDDLLEAARIDGCSEHRIFFSLVLPLIMTVLVSLTIFTFITSWNDFLWPLVIASKPHMKTLTLAIAALKNSYRTNYGLVMSGATLTFMPPFLLYLVLQKQFVEGIALSGIKG
ncbi:carbohydrate ABC transporter permease [Treponema sp. HNW]|uniref:carbohydrate ABC transporter permease n=1 Tax=Treponema sp. HNW TaxID=3116654 RepID=UPI003D133A32